MAEGQTVWLSGASGCFIVRYLATDAGFVSPGVGFAAGAVVSFGVRWTDASAVVRIADVSG